LSSRFPRPQDANADNVYQLDIEARDELGASVTQGLAITVTNVEPEGTIVDGDGDGQDDTEESVLDTDDDEIPDNLDIDDDNDGVESSLEGQVPILTTEAGTAVAGDGNGDGITDTRQTNVSSVPFKNTDQVSQEPEAEPVYVTLVADATEGKPNTTPEAAPKLTRVEQRDAPADKPAEIELPLGLISFTAELQEVGQTETFSLYVDGSLNINGYWKPDANGIWTNLASPEQGGALTREGDKIRLDFQIEDGGRFDEDGIANGVIVDPGAPGFRQDDPATPDCPFDPFKPDADDDGVPDSEEGRLGLDPAVKDNDVFGSNDLFVRQLYRDLLGREADEAGVDYWVARMAQGQDRTQMALTFLDSAEFQTRSEWIAELYQSVLGRPADFCGFNYWLQSGFDSMEIASRFLDSSEFQDRYNSLDNTAFVNQLYLDVLGRSTVDPEGLAYWLNALSAGTSRSEVMLGFLQSEEFQSKPDYGVVATLNYIGLLDREPDPAGFEFWFNQLGNGMSEAEVVGGFLASPEYHDRFLPTAGQAAVVELTGVPDIAVL